MAGQRRYPIGAEVQMSGTHFRVWAPDRRHVEVLVENGPRHELQAEQAGYFSGLVPGARAGSLYRFRLDQVDLVPDPASRFQPSGPHGPSQIIDSSQFEWTDATWAGRQLAGLIIYELHVGTFTTEGTWVAAIRELAELAEIGISCIELMPVADFAGEFGWGYDGVDLFAPTRLYGTPDDFRRFVDAAHSKQIAVLLDVVYNHFGPDGNYLGKFAADYFTNRHETDWGAAINFDGEQSGPVREFFLTNVAYWIQEFHLDGLRLDATQNIYDDSPPGRHILTQIGQQVRVAAPDRKILIIAENEPQLPQLCRSVAAGGYGLDAVWNDDYHHAAMVALTGHREAYYTDYHGSPQEFISIAKYGYLYQGQRYAWHGRPRGQPGFDLPLAAHVNYIQNHDQVANSGRGLRVQYLTSPGRYRALTALTLLMPGTPLLFQGQEFAASSPFFYFADHGAELASLVAAGRTQFLSQFSSLADEHMQILMGQPHDPQAFHRCKLDFSERASHAAEYHLTRDLLKLRQSDPAFQVTTSRAVDGAVLGPDAFALRYFCESRGDRLLLVNLGHDLDLSIVPEPLLSPPQGMQWHILLSTDYPPYGGNGVRPLEGSAGGWNIPAELAVVLSGKAVV